MKIIPVEVQYSHADGQTDTETELTKLIFAFISFARAPKGDTQKSPVTMFYQSIRVVLCYILMRFLCCV
jgi:hypothetical protein